jgi:hypothetical protein
MGEELTQIKTSITERAPDNASTKTKKHYTLPHGVALPSNVAGSKKHRNQNIITLTPQTPTPMALHSDLGAVRVICDANVNRAVVKINPLHQASDKYAVAHEDIVW